MSLQLPSRWHHRCVSCTPFTRWHHVTLVVYRYLSHGECFLRRLRSHVHCPGRATAAWLVALEAQNLCIINTHCLWREKQTLHIHKKPWLYMHDYNIIMLLQFRFIATNKLPDRIQFISYVTYILIHVETWPL